MKSIIRELSVAQLARLLVVQPAHQSSSPRLGAGARIFLDLFHDLTGTILSVVGNVPADSEAPVVTLSILRICRLNLSEVLMGVGLRACVRRGKCACMFELLRLYRGSQKNEVSHTPRVFNLI